MTFDGKEVQGWFGEMKTQFDFLNDLWWLNAGHIQVLLLWFSLKVSLYRP
jgi:hypothetical protein